MITDQTAHRPWPLPQGPWVLFMRWHDLLFLHWPVDAGSMRSLISPQVELEIYDGSAWLGIVPFRMTGVRPRYAPFSLAAAELNVRTYVKSAMKSGVWFFSLDANSWLAVRTARTFGLPYYDARMSVQRDDDTRVEHRSFRIHRRAPAAEFVASYRPVGPIFNAAPGSFDHWLTERYSLYSALKPSNVVYGEIHHPPWPLQRAEVELHKNTMAAALGIQLPDSEPVCHFARYQEVVAWPIMPLRWKANE
jgi:uncharacterized protein YqjF (DUF2071 family)